MTAGTIEVRGADRDDHAAVLELLAESLRWVPDATLARFFEWKHQENPFGTSPAWVAVENNRIVGFRTFLRWEFEQPDGRVLRAVRAVDTATHPDFQGRGVFRKLTLHAVSRLTAEGVDFVFNTPNAQSRPGYLAMGWHDIGRLPTSVRVARARGFARLLLSRVPAERSSIATTAGRPAAAVLADDRIASLLDRIAPATAIRTRRSVAYLGWRYGFDRLGYRAIAADDDPANGIAIFRLRRRGRAREAAVCEVLVPHGQDRTARALLSSIVHDSGADYAIRLARSFVERGYVRMPAQGPALTWRPLAWLGDPPGPSDFDFTLGDIELM